MLSREWRSLKGSSFYCFYTLNLNTGFRILQLALDSRPVISVTDKGVNVFVSITCLILFPVRWQDMEMNLFWLGVGGGSLVIIHFLILIFLRWRTGTPAAHGILSVPRFELFLLILMLPCISQSSAFVIKGNK
jgi:hypothetical protein